MNNPLNLGGAEELWGGVSGIVTKPFKRSHQEGVKGFFKVFNIIILGCR